MRILLVLLLLCSTFWAESYDVILDADEPESIILILNGKEYEVFPTIRECEYGKYVSFELEEVDYGDDSETESEGSIKEI